MISETGFDRYYKFLHLSFSRLFANYCFSRGDGNNNDFTNCFIHGESTPSEKISGFCYHINYIYMEFIKNRNITGSQWDPESSYMKSLYIIS